MEQEQWVERYTNRLWEYHPERDCMWDMEHLGPWMEDDAIEALMMECPDDPERAAGVIFDQLVEEMEMRGEIYQSPEHTSTKLPVWKIWLGKLLPAAIARKS